MSPKSTDVPPNAEWWWRDEEEFEYDEDSHQVKPKAESDVLGWRAQEERIAWTYELVRGVGRHHKKWRAFPELDWVTRVILRHDLSKAPLAWISYPLFQIWEISNKPPGDHWFSVPELLWWNLEASDEALSSKFQNLVKEIRKKRNFPPSPKNRGVKRKPPSWLWVELLHSNRAETPLTESEKKTMKKAEARARQAKKYVCAALRRASEVKKLWRPVGRWQPALGSRRVTTSADPE